MTAIRAWWSRLSERRRAKHESPFTAEQVALLREVRAEARSVRRHRRLVRRLLIRADRS